MPSKHDPADSHRRIIENAARMARYRTELYQQSFTWRDWAPDAVERRIERLCKATIRRGVRADEPMPGQP